MKKSIEENTIGFILQKITTEQFAILEESFQADENTELGTELKFSINALEKRISVFPRFVFRHSKQSPFLIIAVGGHFKISESSWKQFIQSESHQIIVPRNFMAHLCVITVGTTRGILHAKTEGTAFNQFLLPSINIFDIIQKDVPFNISPLPHSD
ncbi:MAG: hypothetical protein MK226_20050 [Saprospiraceae bacterium]|jgi:hypothetical protein|nr:hypothetical protein [Saprospiraceae bacterium]